MVGKVINPNKWDQRFLDMAALVASWSKDASTQVGAVIVDAKNRVVSVGYNGFPRGVEDVALDRDEKLRRTIHAEENALLFARSHVEGCTVYVTHHPCSKCAAKLIQSGIARVVYRSPMSEKWAEEVASADAMFEESSVCFHQIYAAA